MEAALVSAAAGALKPVLGKLATLLGDEYKRFRRVRKEIEFLTREMAAMEAFLHKKSMEEDPDPQDKVWMKEVRELSYDIEDSLDDFMENARGRSAKPGGFMKKIKSLLDTTKDRRQIAKAIEDLKRQVVEASERHKRYESSEVFSKANHITPDPRALAIFADVSTLVGIDGPKNELIRLFAQEDRRESSQQQPTMISVVGFGGLGKTTLAFQVYKELKDQSDCYAFVSVSRNPDMMKVLGSIHKQITGAGYSSIEDIPQLITRISNFLADKRYFIVVDDIWNVEIWDVIKLVFPLNACGGRIITTTRVNSVAQSCRSSFNGHLYNMDPLSTVHSRQLFHKRLFNSEKCPKHLEEVSSKILEKCAGLPLAIIAISGLLANKAKVKDQWHQVESSIGRGLERNSSIEGMIKIISLSFFDLPHHLQACLLYLSIFPEDYSINKEILIRRWIAEGFIGKQQGCTLYEAGEMCFNELINRSLIQPDFKEQIFDEVSDCRVHDTILDFIVSKSTEENFVTIIGVPGINPDMQNKVRRLSVQNGSKIPAGLILSGVRSLNIFNGHVMGNEPNLENDYKIPSLLEFKHLRVLCFEDWKYIEDHHLAGIGSLLHLKCLRLTAECTTGVPEDIANLHHLETLDIYCDSELHSVSVPATFSPDGRLVHFVVGPCDMPDEIEGIKALEVLGSVDMENHSVEFYRRIGDLKNLRKLQVHAYACEEEERELACAISKLVKANLRFLQISAHYATSILEEELDLPADCTLQELYIDGGIKHVPRWVGTLVNLEKLNLFISGMTKEDMDILGSLPALRYLYILYSGPSAASDQMKAGLKRVMEAHSNHPMLVWKWYGRTSA